MYHRYPLPGHLKGTQFPLNIYSSGSVTDRRRCEAQGEAILASLRTKIAEGRFFDKQPPKELPYNPKYWRIVGRYWYYHLRFKKSAKNERYNLLASLRSFGMRYAKEIYREEIEAWRNKKKSSLEVNSINNQFAYLCRSYSYANSESNPRYRLNYNPTTGMGKLSGAKVRQFLLTPERFERNYAVLRDGMRWPGDKPNKHGTEWRYVPSPRFALLYLALWETGRRPVETSLYTWEMVTEYNIDGETVQAFLVPSEITKTEEPQPVPISERLWREMSQLGYRTGLVFRNEDGNQWQHWKRHMEKLKALFGKHEAGWARDTRRGFVTRKTEVDGCDPAHVRQCTGHRTESVFRRYRIGQTANLFAVVNKKASQSKDANCVQFVKTA